jgi:hypothetical protein
MDMTAGFGAGAGAGGGKVMGVGAGRVMTTGAGAVVGGHTGCLEAVLSLRHAPTKIIAPRNKMQQIRTILDCIILKTATKIAFLRHKASNFSATNGYGRFGFEV